MSTVAIVHHSETGYTDLLADAVARGVEQVAEVKLERVRVVGTDIIEGRYREEAAFETLDACQAIILGFPTYMGGVSAQMKAFFDASLQRWYGRGWSDKLGAAFTVSSTPSGDKLNALADALIFALQHGMVWVGLDESPMNGQGINRLGVYVGAAAQPDYSAAEKSLQPGDELTGERLGVRVAEQTLRLGAAS